MPLQVGELKIQTLEDIDVEERKIFLRVDLNAPIQDGKVTDDTRIRAVLPTLNFLLEARAKVVMASHLGRPKGKPDPKYSLLPVAERLAELLRREVILPDDCVGDGVEQLVRQQKSEDVILLENLRFHPGEEKNDPAFANELRLQRDAYITDAFGALHRAHASTDALPRLFPVRAAGFLVAKECEHLAPLLAAPARPYAVILGGAKVSDKIKVIETLFRYVDHLFLGGAMVFTFLKAMGHSVGSSLVENDQLDRAKDILAHARAKKITVHFPKDFVAGRSVEEPGPPKLISGMDIPEGWMGLDVGPESVDSFGKALSTARTIFWNGPLGLFEKPPYDQGTTGLAKLLGEMTSVRVIGGGDSAAAVVQAGVAERMTHISTGGGATLEFLEGTPLPGLKALAV